MRTTSFVKKPIGKTREVALRGKAKGKVPTGQVVVYSYGDEMYRKVRVSTLTMCSRVELSKPYGGKGNAAAAAAAGAAMSWCCNVLIGCIMMRSFFVHSCECNNVPATLAIAAGCYSHVVSLKAQ